MALLDQNLRKGIRLIRRGPALSALLTMLLLAVPLAALLSHYDSELLRQARSDLDDLLEPHCNALSLTISNRLSLINGLKAYVETLEYNDGPRMADEFPRFAAVLCEGIKGTRNV